MADPSQRPPDLDANLQPLQPPDLDEKGLPVFRSSTSDVQKGEVASLLGVMPGALGLEDPITDAFKGAVKGALDTAETLGHFLRMVPGINALDRLVLPLHPNLAPTNMAQRVGKGAERIAEVAAPSGLVTDVGKAAALRAAPRLAPLFGETAARVIPRAVVEGGIASAQAVSQGGDPMTAGVLGAVAPGVSEVADRFAPALVASAEKKVVQALGPTKERFKAIANRLASEILKRGLGGSRAVLQQQAADTLETVGDQLDTALQANGHVPLSTQPVVAALETAKDAFRTSRQMSVGDAAAAKVLDKATAINNGMATIPVEFEPRAIKQLSGLQDVMKQLGPTATVDQLTAVRRAWDKVVSQAGGYAQRAGGAIGVPLKDQSEAFAKREGAGAIRKLLADEVPDLAAINKEYSFWKNLDDVVTQTMQRTQGQGPGLGRQVAEGAAAAAASSNGLGAAFGVGKIAKMANAVFTSPRWRFIDANLRNQLADAIVSGSAQRVGNTLARIGSVQASQLPAAVGAR